MIFEKEIEGRKWKFKVEVKDNGNIILTVGGISSEARAYNRIGVGFGFRVYSHKIAKLFGKTNPSIFFKAPQAEAIRKIVKEKEAKIEKQKEQILDEIYNGKRKMKVWFCEGSPLSGYMPDTEETCKVLEKLGLAHDVSGWGTLVDDDLINALGTEFTYQQVYEYIKPRLDVALAKELKRKKEIEEKFRIAKETGKPVLIKEYVTECNDPAEECNLDLVRVFALPNGKTEEKRIHTY